MGSITPLKKARAWECARDPILPLTVQLRDMDLMKPRAVLEHVIELTESPLTESPETLGLGLPGLPFETPYLQSSLAKRTGDACHTCFSKSRVRWDPVL